jgi:allantoinase
MRPDNAGCAVGEVTAIRGRRVITPDGERAATVLLREGVIAGLAGYAGAPDGALTLAGDEVLLPGLVDSHVHVNEPGRTEWEGFATATAAAAAGGVTTIVDMPLNSIPPTVTVPALRAKQAAAAGQLATDVAFWGGAVPGNVADLRPLHEAGVVGFKCFLLPSGVDEFAPLDAGQLAVAMAEIASFGGLLVVHAEDPEVIAAAPAARGRRYADFLASRPPEAERRAITALLALTRQTGCRTHIVHLASGTALPAIRAAKAAGLPVSAETCPHYLTLRAEDVPDGATQFKCCPPIRDDANREALWAGLLDGTIDCVVSDHSPCPAAAKRMDTGDFGDAWGGIASVQLTGLADRGAIRPGLRADLCCFAPGQEFVVDAAALRHRNPVTPYAGRTLTGVVRQTWLAGRRAGTGPPAGQLVSVTGRAAGGRS